MKKEIILPSEEEILKIRNRDIETISKYYLLNLDLLKSYVRTFCRRINDYSEFDDYVQEIFLHFHKLSFESGSFFGNDCNHILADYYLGGAKKRKQMYDSKFKRDVCVLYSPIKGTKSEEILLVDTLVTSEENTFLKNNENIKSEDFFSFCCLFLAKEQSKVFEQIYWSGLSYREVAEVLSKNVFTVRRTVQEIYKKLRLYKNEIIDFLKTNNYEIELAI